LNNQILCNLNRGGLLREACIATGLLPVELLDRGELPLPGVRAHKVLAGGGPWPFGVRLESANPVNLEPLAGTSVSLPGNVFPLFSIRYQNLRLCLLAFAPAAQANSSAPRAAMAVIQIQNDSQQTVRGAVLAPAKSRTLSERDNARSEKGNELVTCLDETTWQPHFPEVNFILKAGERKAFTFALILGESTQDLKHTETTVRDRPVLDWLHHTWQFHASRLGRLAIPESPFFAEFQTRLEEVCRQAQLRTGDGSFAGGFLGSYISQETKTWAKDCFYAGLPKNCACTRFGRPTFGQEASRYNELHAQALRDCR